MRIITSQANGLQKRENKMEEKQKNDCKCDVSKHIKGINCDVKSCAYHSGETQCCAGSISVGPRDASCSANTECATFKPKAF